MSVVLSVVAVLVGVVLLGLLVTMAATASRHEQALYRRTAAWWTVRVVMALVLAVVLDVLWRAAW